MSNACRVMRIPELAEHIAGDLSKADLYRLLRVSRIFFCAIAPLMWKEVPRVDIILSLMGGAAIERTMQRDWDFVGCVLPHIHINLPDTPQLTRFNIYALWVQKLEVFQWFTRYVLINHSGLAAIASNRPLLPGLRSIKLSTKLGTKSEDWTLFTDLFLCPALVEIQHISEPISQQYLDLDDAYPLAQRFSSVCPGLKILEFYPKWNDLLHDEWSHLVYSPDVAFPRILARFSALRSFSSTALILSPLVFEVLGNLPLLESLGIVDYRSVKESPPILSRRLQIPDYWFQSLRNLRIYDLHPRDITVPWNQPPIVQNLLSVTMQCYPTTPDNSEDSEQGHDEEDSHDNSQLGQEAGAESFGVDNEGGDGDEEEEEEEEQYPDGQEWINRFLENLTRASPHVEKLELDFDCFEWDPQSYSLWDTREYLRWLPLRKLKFNATTFDQQDALIH